MFLGLYANCYISLYQFNSCFSHLNIWLTISTALIKLCLIWELYYFCMVLSWYYFIRLSLGHPIPRSCKSIEFFQLINLLLHLMIKPSNLLSTVVVLSKLPICFMYFSACLSYILQNISFVTLPYWFLLKNSNNEKVSHISFSYILSIFLLVLEKQIMWKKFPISVFSCTLSIFLLVQKQIL